MELGIKTPAGRSRGQSPSKPVGRSARFGRQHARREFYGNAHYVLSTRQRRPPLLATTHVSRVSNKKWYRSTSGHRYNATQRVVLRSFAEATHPQQRRFEGLRRRG